MIITNKIENLKVKKAEYIDAFKLSIAFNDGKRTIVDFKPFLDSHQNGCFKKYTNPANFKNFHIENGNLVWGESWDLIFPINQLHKGKIKL